MLRLALPILIFLLLSFMSQGCTPYNAPIVDLDQPPSQLIKTHLVEEGETLYSIAWRYDFNTRELAKINGFSENYQVRKGQVLNLDKNLVPKSRSIIVKEDKVLPKIVTKLPQVLSQSEKKTSEKKLRSMTFLNGRG